MGGGVAPASRVNRVQAPDDVDDRSAPLQTRAFPTNRILREIAAGAPDETGFPMSIGKRTRPPIPTNPARPPPTEKGDAAGQAFDEIKKGSTPDQFKKALEKVNSQDFPPDQRATVLQ